MSMVINDAVVAENVCVVTVTYGRRWVLLRQVLQRVLEQGVGNLVVIDNASEEDITDLADKDFGARVCVVRLPENSGSAGGFHQAIECALRTEAGFIWLLDDDCLPESNALTSLLMAYNYLGAEDCNALLAFRPQWPAFRRLAIDGYDKTSVENRFQGMHLCFFADLFYRHILGKDGKKSDGPIRFVLARIGSGAYGGLFLPREMVARIGLPKIEFYLYGDDIDYTRRIEKSGGGLYLCVQAVIHDLDSSWICRTQDRVHPFFSAGTSEARIYYGVRNQAILDREQARNRIIYTINGLLFFLGLLVLSVFRSSNLGLSTKRVALIGKALWAGWHRDMRTPIWLRNNGES